MKLGLIKSVPVRYREVDILDVIDSVEAEIECFESKLDALHDIKNDLVNLNADLSKIKNANRDNAIKAFDLAIRMQRKED